MQNHRRNAGAKLSRSRILAPPIHAETALRIFSLASFDTSMGTPVYTRDALLFLCDVYQPLFKFHTYIFETRRDAALNGTNESSLLSVHV